MTIPASHIVNVEPRVITGGSSDLEMNGLVLSKNPLISTGSMVLEFNSSNAVGAYFGLESPEYAAALTYFTGYENKTSAPRSFFVARRVDQAVPGWLRGATYHGSLNAIKAVSDGAMTIEIDSVSHSLSGLDFSSATSFSESALVIQTAIEEAIGSQGVTVGYSSLNGCFTITSSTTGELSLVGYGQSPSSGTDLAALLGFSQKAGAVQSPGSASLTVDEQMAAIRSKSENWVSFTTLWEAECEEILSWAEWANKNYGWLYVAYTTDPATADQDSLADPASALKSSGFEFSTIVYGTLDYALFIMGAVACISWLRTNGTITLAFKRQPGLAAYVTEQGQAEALETKNCNYFGNFSTRNAEFVFLYPGVMSASQYGYIDPYINSVWLNNRLQVALMDGLSGSGRVPYNERGYTMIRAWMMDPITQALTNGAIEIGIELSERQKSELFSESGMDISADLAIQGYFIQIQDPGAGVRARRESPAVNLWYTYGGSVQRIEVASTVIL